MEPALEQVPPQVPVHLYPQVALADSDEDRRLRDSVGGEVVQLHLVMSAERTEESACWDTETPLVQPRQADDVAAQGLSAPSPSSPEQSTPGVLGRCSAVESQW